MIEIANRCILTTILLLIGTNAWGIDLSSYFGNSYAVVIGINRYQKPGILTPQENAEHDTQAMSNFLARQGFQVRRFVGRQATKGNIIEYLADSLAPRLKQNDRFIFYFSGHGNTRLIGGRDRGYLIPYDGETEKPSTWISMEQLQEFIDKFTEVRHQLFILDSCFGGFFATKWAMSTTYSESTSRYIATVTGSRARQYLMAGGINQKTPPHSNLNGYRQYSYYTAYLLKGLREGAADTHPDGYITASELNAYLAPAAATDYNTPRGGHFPGHEQGDFIFRSPKHAQIVRNSSPMLGPTKGKDENSYEVEKLRAEVERLERLRAAQRSKYTAESYSKSVAARKTLTKEEQAQALYEWQQDIRYSSSSRPVEQFLQRFPTGSHVSAALRKLEELREYETNTVRTYRPITRTYSPVDNAPQFPWPPPHPSAYSLIPSKLLPSLTNKNDLKNVAKKLETAFDQAGYSQKKYYQVPDGFALVSQLEQFHPDGTSKTPPDRWVADYLPPKIFSLTSYIKALFTANSGRYRIIAFIVTSQSFKDSKKTVTRDEAMTWLDDGMVILPESIGKQPYTDKHYCTAYIYEFEQPGKEKKPSFKPLSNLTGKDHLQKSKLWAALKK